MMPDKRKKAVSNGKTKKTKSGPKESFLAGVEELNLYTNEDRYYTHAQTEVGPLELEWFSNI